MSILIILNLKLLFIILTLIYKFLSERIMLRSHQKVMTEYYTDRRRPPYAATQILIKLSYTRA